MDNHFSDIINTFKRLDESTKNSHGHNKKQQAAIAIAKQGMAEDGMHDAEHHAHGPEFTGYWAGTDSRTPGKKMVGGSAEESIEEEIMREWDTYLAELGANNPAQGAAQGVAQQHVVQKQMQNAVKTTGQIKSKIGLPTGVSQGNVVKAIAGAQPGQDPTKLPGEIKKADSALGDLAGQFFNKASDADKNAVLQKMQQTAAKPAGTP